MNDAIAQARNSTAIISERSVWSLYPGGARKDVLSIPTTHRLWQSHRFREDLRHYGEEAMTIAGNEGITISVGCVVLFALTDPSYCTMCPRKLGYLWKDVLIK